MEIITNTLSEAHEAACAVIIDQHREIDIQTHTDKQEFTLEFNARPGEDDFLVLRILHPQQEPLVSAGTKYGPGFTAAYKKQFLTLSPPRADGNHATYTYWNRLADYPMMRPVDICTGPNEESHTGYLQYGDGRGGGFNQATALIDKLAADRNSRRGVRVIWYPEFDSSSTEPPCMDMVQIVVRDNTAHIRVVFRSQDMLMGLPENLVGVTALLEYIAYGIQKKCGIGISVGCVTLVSLIPHIYKKRDTSDFDLMRKEIHRKKSLGLWHPIIR
jgi:thymidylate synthase (methanogen type)